MHRRIGPIVWLTALCLCLTLPLAADAAVSVRDFGALGDGRADDTAAVQAAVDSLGKTGGTILFPPGTYMLTEVNVRDGLTLQGDAAIIRKKDTAGKWARTFTTQKAGYRYSGEVDSRPLVIRDLIFDGNRDNQGPYTRYQLEQAHMIFLTGDRSQAGRLRAIVENCVFRDCVADGISIYSNVDAKVSRCSAVDVFRGAVTITGGYSRVQISDLTAGGSVHPTGIDVEVDGAGYQNSFKTDIQMNNLQLEGDFDLGLRDGSTFIGSNICSGSPFNLYARASTVRISNSTFGIGLYSSNSNRFVAPNDVVFDNCTFYAQRREGEAGDRFAPVHIYWGSEQKGQRLLFQGCDFRVGEGIRAEDTLYAVYAEASMAENDNLLMLRNCRIGEGFDYGVWINQGGNVQLFDVHIEAETGIRLSYGGKYYFNALLEGVTFGSGNRVTELILGGHPANRLTHRRMELTSSANTLTSGVGLEKLSLQGGRLIWGREAPSAATPGLCGDIYRLQAPLAGEPAAWICTAGGGAAAMGGSAGQAINAAVWRPLVMVTKD